MTAGINGLEMTYMALGINCKVPLLFSLSEDSVLFIDPFRVD